jgi:hypothetical protein
MKYENKIPPKMSQRLRSIPRLMLPLLLVTIGGSNPWNAAFGNPPTQSGSDPCNWIRNRNGTRAYTNQRECEAYMRRLPQYSPACDLALRGSIRTFKSALKCSRSGDPRHQLVGAEGLRYERELAFSQAMPFCGLQRTSAGAVAQRVVNPAECRRILTEVESYQPACDPTPQGLSQGSWTAVDHRRCQSSSDPRRGTVTHPSNPN